MRVPSVTEVASEICLCRLVLLPFGMSTLMSEKRPTHPPRRKQQVSLALPLMESTIRKRAVPGNQLKDYGE